MRHLEFHDVEIHELKSEIIGETFEILVKQPDPNIISLFGLYTLFHQPKAFKRYVIGSPWQEWSGK